MKLPSIITTDLHYTASPADEYRWGLFPWLKQQAKEYKARSICILGDLTDAKDYHSSVLVNRLVKEITGLTEVVEQVYILSGNHDYLKDGHPFFSFLSAIPGVKFINEVFSDTDDDLPVLWLPHSKNPAKEWAGFKDLSWYSHIFMHQTMSGSMASNGQEMGGEGVEQLHWFKAGRDLPCILSGDIHVPQKLGLVEYVGSPYPVHFGDSFDARCILMRKDGSRKNLHFDTIRRPSFVVDDVNQLFEIQEGKKVSKGDQVKFKVLLPQSEQHEWPKWRTLIEGFCRSEQLELCGLRLEIEKSRRRLQEVKKAVNPDDVVLSFVEDEGLTAEAFEAAMEVMQ